MSFSGMKGYINSHIAAGNQEPLWTPEGSRNLLGDSDLGICLFPLVPLDVTQPNTSCMDVD